MAEAKRVDAPSEGLVERALDAARRVVEVLGARQRDDHWPSDYGGPLFLLPGLVIAYHATRQDFGAERRARMVRYLESVQRPDGGWGLHVEGESTVLGTALNYVALRLLGMAADAAPARRGRERLLALGGAEGIPTWGKFWLATLGVYRWEGVPALPPELWLLPRLVPFHPSRWWCHTRAVFLPMSACYGRRVSAPEDEVVQALRREVFAGAYDSLDWPALRERVAKGDLYTPHSAALRTFNSTVLAQYERRPSRRLRARALRHVEDLMHHEDVSTSYLDIGPVSKAIDLLYWGLTEPGGERLRAHLGRVDDYLWDGADGTRMQGYNGSQLWDVAFAMQALLELRGAGGEASVPAPLNAEIDGVLRPAYRFLDRNQVRRDVDRYERYHRDRTEGCWPFSTVDQAWAVSDCTAEGLKVALKLRELAPAVGIEALAAERLERAVDRLLEAQNEDGGWSEYERARAPGWIEQLNAAEVFGDIMIAHSYVECTSACIQGLRAHAAAQPGYRAAELRQAIARGAAFISGKQRPDGGFYGGWGVCFTYGTWFAIEGLLAAGEAKDDPRVQRAVEFLLAHQRVDGAWGEAFASCVEHRYVQHERGQVVQTGWAVLALLAVLRSDSSPRVIRAVERGVAFLLERQGHDGGYEPEAIAGVFNRNCAINYDNYRFIFPLWALARYVRVSRAAGA